MRRPLVVALVPLVMAVACSSSGPTDSGATRPQASPSRGGTAPSPLPQGADKVTLDPAEFTTTIDHPFWPMARANTWVYQETTSSGTVQRVEVTVTDKTKEILGIQATVVHDVVSVSGQVIEDTFDWYAQDRTGNLWYLGEDTKEYRDGVLVTTEGSWEAGVDGAQAGIILPAHPIVGLEYRQEYYKGQAEDAAEILSLNEQADVPYGSFDHLLETKDYTPLEPDATEHKFYAEGIGPVLTISASGSGDREELISFHRA